MTNMARTKVPDAYISSQFVISGLFDADVNKRILPKRTLGIQVSGQETTVAIQSNGRGQAAHVCARHNVVQEFVNVGDGCVHCHLGVTSKAQCDNTDSMAVEIICEKLLWRRLLPSKHSNACVFCSLGRWHMYYVPDTSD